jgi:hypothetical protein
MEIRRTSVAAICLLAAIAFQLEANAYKYTPHKQGSGVQESSDSRAAACAPATGLREMEWNNVRVLIETGGSMWQDRSTSLAAYEVPAGGGVSAMYAGALWMGGIERGSQQLKVAATTFREGNDFWTGPLTNNTAEVSEETCQKYDRFYVSYRQDVARHRGYWECKTDPFCDENEEYPAYSTPSYFYDWPAHGNVAEGQDYYLAPFYDFDGGGFATSGVYDPGTGDYPAFDIAGEIDCDRRSRETTVPLYGDFNMYWIFNDKGNVHTETNGEPIGMEIRAQAFAFASNDEVNNMTFYNYLLINQGTKILEETYFGQWADPDLGTSTDDFVGCDVSRGLAYCYNGVDFDPPSLYSKGYGDNPPAIGVDFFEGPFQDNDGVDNPLTNDYSEAIAGLGVPYFGIGMGYGDGVIDNERFGMRKFIYYNNGDYDYGDPKYAVQYYNYLTGKWRNGACLEYGGNGNTTGFDVCADFMFPGDSDPYGWGTEGVAQGAWTEENSDNQEGDRRFIQSAGPFVLEPGARNNVTVGVVYARATGGGAFQSVSLLKVADDKAQALFNNCFNIVDGPDAPDVVIQEMDREIILLLENDNVISNNYHEQYAELDPVIPENTSDGSPLTEEARSYKFQGYQVYQLREQNVSVSQLEDVDAARLIYTTDVKDSIMQIVNYEFDPVMNLPVPVLKAEGEDLGIQHSFSVKHDAFATGDTRLINHRAYYFLVLAYGYNMYEPFNPNQGYGQFKPYIASRMSAGSSIRVHSGIPHVVNPEAGGTTAQVHYGDFIPLTQLEGRGNGMLELEMAQRSRANIMQGAPWKIEAVEYTSGGSPIEVKVVDPLLLQDIDYLLRINPEDLILDTDTIRWELLNQATGDVIHSSFHTMSSPFEEIIPQHGISVLPVQHYFSDERQNFTEFLSASIGFEDGAPWLLGVEDEEGFSAANWIRSGSQQAPEGALGLETIVHDVWPPNPLATFPIPFNDPDEDYESILRGTWAPYCQTSWSATVDNVHLVNVAPRKADMVNPNFDHHKARLKDLNNVDVVFTSNRNEWTRCPVLEMQSNEERAEGAAEKMDLRNHASVDKDGLTVAQGGDQWEATHNGDEPFGMGWFPGYAIDINTGERLNMAFGEDSGMLTDNGNDMLWNPSNRVETSLGEVVAGGQHWIYIFKNTAYYNNDGWIPSYDEGATMFDLLVNGSNVDRLETWKSCTWVGSAILGEGFEWKAPSQGLIPGKAELHLRVARPFNKYRPLDKDMDDTSESLNNWNPLYAFSTRNMNPEFNSDEVLEDALAMINVVPNPYYAFSEYENNKLDHRVKFTNLPEECVVSIYSVSGTLVRQFDKSDPLTSLDWDLKNQTNVPIAGGVYIIHIDVPGIGEKILKWFGVVRPVDLDSF